MSAELTGALRGEQGENLLYSIKRENGMVLSGNFHNYAETKVRRQNGVSERGRGLAPVRGGNDFLGKIAEASEKASEKGTGNTTGTAGDAENTVQEEFSKNRGSTSELINEVTKDGRKYSREDLLQIIGEHREEILKKLKNGDTGVKIPIGSLCLTEEEWEKLLDSFDEAQDKIKEEVRAKSGEELPEKRPDTTVNGDKVLAAEDTGHDVKPLEEVISEISMEPVLKDETKCGVQGETSDKTGSVEAWQVEREKQLQSAGVKKAESFGDVFPDMQVITKVGDCKVSPGIWCRTDFPFWEYFKKGTSADALNNWQPSGPQPSMLDPKIQRNLSGIGAGKISILIPEKLQAKMDADPVYAQEIYRKVAKWKEDYDAWDNATAASLGMNVAEHQLSKSYCVQLDEDGDVGNFTVVSMGGEITQSGKDVEDNWLKRRNAAILFHKQHLARMGYTGLTGTAGIVTQEGEGSPLALLRAALTVGILLEDPDRDKDKERERTKL